MKKKILFCLAVLGTASMLFGFDSAETVDSLLEKTQAASAKQEGAVVDMDMNLDASIDVSDSTTSSSLELAASGSCDYAVNMNPAAIKMNASFNISAIGSNESTIVKIYGVPSDDGGFDLYTYLQEYPDEEGSWSHETSSADIFDFTDLQTASVVAELEELGIDLELAPEASVIGGKECYLLTAVMDSSFFWNALDKAGEIYGEDINSDGSMDMIMSILDGVRIKFEYYIDSTSYLPVKFHVDLNDSDLSALSQYITMSMGELAADSTIGISLNDISLDAAIIFGSANDITVPEEALAAESADIPGTIGEIKDIFGSITN